MKLRTFPLPVFIFWLIWVENLGMPDVFFQKNSSSALFAQGPGGGNRGNFSRGAGRGQRGSGGGSGNVPGGGGFRGVPGGNPGGEAASPNNPTDAATSEPQIPPSDPIRDGTVPAFSTGANPLGANSFYSQHREDAFYNESIDRRRNDDAVPVASLTLRRYADSMVEKYDFNRDGLLQESEWSQAGGNLIAADLNGDFMIEPHEILYYLARYAKDRTIFQPVPPMPTSQQHVVTSDRPVLIRPLSAPIKRKTSQEAEKAKASEGLADLTEEEFTELMETTEEQLGVENDPALFGVLLEEMDESKQREYAAPLEVVRGMPVWFLARDLNGDGQLSLVEFAPGLSLEAVAFFGKLDVNSDGFVIPDEVRAYMAKQQTAMPR